MAYKFNPPPNWPPAPEDWTPPPGWQPDPAWGPAPDGWEFWVNTDVESDTGAHDTSNLNAGEGHADIQNQGVSSGDSPSTVQPGATSQPADLSAAPMQGGGQLNQNAAPGSAQPGPSGAGTPAAPPAWNQAPNGINGPNKPQKGFFARFWWIFACCALLLIAALTIAGILVFRLATNPPPSPSSSSSHSQSTSSTPRPVPPSSSQAPAPSSEAKPSPTAAGIQAPSGASQEISAYSGQGKVTVSMRWAKGEDMKNFLDRPVDPAQNGEYLVVEATAEASQDGVEVSPLMFKVVKPNGERIRYSTNSLSLKQYKEATNKNPSNIAKPGNPVTRVYLFDLSKASGLELEYDNFKNKYYWEVPAS